MLIMKCEMGYDVTASMTSSTLPSLTFFDFSIYFPDFLLFTLQIPSHGVTAGFKTAQKLWQIGAAPTR